MTGARCFAAVTLVVASFGGYRGNAQEQVEILGGAGVLAELPAFVGLSQ